jgi:hypothetical protein
MVSTSVSVLRRSGRVQVHSQDGERSSPDSGDLPAIDGVTLTGSCQALVDEGAGELAEVVADGVGEVAHGSLPGEYCQPLPGIAGLARLAERAGLDCLWTGGQSTAALRRSAERGTRRA